ncbi:MAG: response regulator transcription factor [Myxococcaceae bacterium]|nr:response regulator transcription factor [Myxococcaceae bacterium]
MLPVRVFVVEDDPKLLANVLKVLALYPELEVVGSARDGEAALNLLTESKPEVLLLDLELPGIDGIGVTKAAKIKLPSVEVLILTSFDEEQKVYEAMQAGASGYLVKRVGPEKIRSAIQEVMQGGTVIEAGIAKRFWAYFQSVQSQTAAVIVPWGLTEPEVEVLQYMAKGLSNAEMGRVMSIERRTVRTLLSHLYRKMGVSSHVDAVVKALQAGVVRL